jgi:serine/threonine-protein kinase
LIFFDHSRYGVTVTIKCPECETSNTDTARFCNNCASPLESEEFSPSRTKTLETPKEELTSGSEFAGRFQIIEELGRGGMGKVYKAIDKKINEKIALKLIKPEIASDKKIIDRFNNELRMARKIGHRHVGRMYDINEEEGTHYITMEYISGQDLKGLIRQSGQLAVGTTISIAKQVCQGLSEAHRLDVIHRDLKPSNIMIDKTGNVRIMDFGIARSIKAKGITGTGMLVGTPEYMSPEQIEGKSIDKRSDLYSLGVILYEMVTGRVPFEGETPFVIGAKHRSEKPQDPGELNPQIPEELSSVILKCLVKESSKRYQSADELLSELERIEKDIPLTDREIPRKKTSTSKEVTVTLSLKKFLIPGLVIIALAFIAVQIWPPFGKEKPAPPPSDAYSIAVLPFTDLSPEKDQGNLCEGLADSIINAVSKVQDIRIPGRASSFAFKDDALGIQEIGRRLGVQTVLEGSIQKSASEILISAQLINVADGMLLWAEQYHRDIENIFTIQTEISMKIKEKLEITLLGMEKGDPNDRSKAARYKVF